MKCEFCHKVEASVHVKQIIDGMVQEVFLCAECAAKNAPAVPADIADFLFGTAPAVTPAENTVPTRCPGCNISFADYESKHRLGCAQCYDTFRDKLMPMIDDMHRAVKHVGKVPVGEKSRRELEKLKVQLLQAVKVQNFEKAAELRDRIKALEGE